MYENGVANSEKIYGFRFMLLGIKNGLYAVKDLEDNGIEYFNREVLFDLASKVKIMGVEHGVIDLDWFKG